jgi:ribokinase
VVDTTAAGDGFCGALAACLAAGRSLREALRFANAAAALVVTRAGAQPSLPQRSEIEAFLASAVETA